MTTFFQMQFHDAFGGPSTTWVIVSNDGANSSAERSGHGVITVVPVTSNVTRIYPFQVLIPADATGLDVDSKAQVEQVR